MLSIKFSCVLLERQKMVFFPRILPNLGRINKLSFTGSLSEKEKEEEDAICSPFLSLRFDWQAKVKRCSSFLARNVEDRKFVCFSSRSNQSPLSLISEMIIIIKMETNKNKSMFNLIRKGERNLLFWPVAVEPPRFAAKLAWRVETKWLLCSLFSSRRIHRSRLETKRHCFTCGATCLFFSSPECFGEHYEDHDPEGLFLVRSSRRPLTFLQLVQRDSLFLCYVIYTSCVFRTI